MSPTPSTPTNRTLPLWVMAVLPLAFLAALVLAFLWLNPLAFFTGTTLPIENLTVEKVLFPAPGQMTLLVINGGPQPVTIAQIAIDDAYWHFTIEPSNTLGRLETATISLNYPWVKAEPLLINLVTSTGVTFETPVEAALTSPEVNGRTLLAYALLGIYVGVVPIVLGMLWYPFMRQMDRKWMNAILSLTIGLLVFLFIDTVVEALELANESPGAFQGVPVVFLVLLLTTGLLLAIGQRQGESTPLGVATLIALGIGLHNLGEGLAIGAAFATGSAALGSFLVIGFTLHNITEGVGIASPLLKEQPTIRTFFLLALLAGGPAILGAWLGSLAFSPFMATLFLSVGAGAILQVIWEVGKLVTKEAQRQKQPTLSWLNFAGVTAGILIMYLTAFLVN